MQVELDNPYSGFLRQFRRTRAIKVSISFDNIFVPHVTEFEFLNASSTSTYSDDHCIIVQGHGHTGIWVFTARVAIIFGVSQSVTPRAWNRFQTSGSATQCHAGGRQRATMPRRTDFLVVQASSHPFVNATTLLNEFRNVVGVNISTQTVHNCLQQVGLRVR